MVQNGSRALYGGFAVRMWFWSYHAGNALATTQNAKFWHFSTLPTTKNGNFGPLSGPRGGITATLPKSILGRCIVRARVSLEQHHRDRGAESGSRVPEIWIRRQRCVRLDEFYKKGCQEKKFFLDRIRDFFLEIQPTIGSLLWRSLACCPFSRVFSADGDDAIEFERAASELAASEATMVLSEAHGLWLFLVIRDI
jgi:hypothetical protein